MKSLLSGCLPGADSQRGEIVEACGIDISDLVQENLDNLKDEYWDDFIKDVHPDLGGTDNGIQS